MCDALAESRACGEIFVEMDRVMVTRCVCVRGDSVLRNRAAKSIQTLADCAWCAHVLDPLKYRISRHHNDRRTRFRYLGAGVVRKNGLKDRPDASSSI